MIKINKTNKSCNNKAEKISQIANNKLTTQYHQENTIHTIDRRRKKNTTKYTGKYLVQLVTGIEKINQQCTFKYLFAKQRNLINKILVTTFL